LEIDSEKVETKQYLIKEKYRDEYIFDKREVKNNTIDYYRLPIDSSNPD